MRGSVSESSCSAVTERWASHWSTLRSIIPAVTYFVGTGDVG
jgi:hypothetical protein